MGGAVVSAAVAGGSHTPICDNSAPFGWPQLDTVHPGRATYDTLGRWATHLPLRAGIGRATWPNPPPDCWRLLRAGGPTDALTVNVDVGVL